ncbi:MAG TPA: GPR endopeptidase [Clostridiales bacterium]|nr:GPR endopeptidase [Clostridiales bacterium]
MNKNIRTDLALEVRESFEQDSVEIKGVILKEEFDKKNDIRTSIVEIKDEAGAKAMERDIGKYITIEASKMNNSDEDYNKPLSKTINKYLKTLIENKEYNNVLVVGLGNRDVTPDALGPEVIDNLFITRHIINEFGDEFKSKNKLGNVSAISPGVMAQTGMEAVEIIKGIIKETKPDLIIVVDALASRSVKRLNTTVQLTNTGISPGSGVGNNRKAINKSSTGVDVIAIGVPTVVDAATIVSDTLTQYMEKFNYEENDIYQFINDINENAIFNMFVTPKDIDESIKRISFTISEALNSCFSTIS